MRGVPCLFLVLAACVHGGAQFYPVHPDEAVPGQPLAATAVANGVRLTVHAGDWRGEPYDLEDRLTPVEAWVENDSGHSLRVGSEHFGLLGPNGFRYQALDPAAVQAAFAAASRGSVAYYGAYGVYPWPGYWGPWRHRVYPYMGFGWYGPPPPAVVQMPAAPPPPPRGTLATGGNVSLLLFFPIPASRLGAMEISMDLEDAAGGRLGVVRVGLTRQPPAAAPAPSTAAPPPEQPAAAQPPTPPPAAPPPPPPR